MAAHERWQRVNLVALLFAAGILAALGLAWWRDRAHTFERPRWNSERLVQLAPEAPDMPSRQRWVVAVNLNCSHCQQHLLALYARTAGRSVRPALAALIVDHTAHPGRVDLGVPLEGGAWWDSARVWRESWGRRAYGETFRFDAKGKLLSSTPTGVVPDSSGSRM